ncbi:MAG: branched-chain amino acid transport [Nocardioides sp.]|nr:branched-chain amino acid transport [Nocardioides sp.]
MIWLAVGITGVACYLLKLAGLSVPPRVLERPLVERIADFIPVALLAALIAVQVFSRGHSLAIDARAVGLGVAVVLLVLRAPFLVVVFGAATVVVRQAAPPPGPPSPRAASSPSRGAGPGPGRGRSPRSGRAA